MVLSRTHDELERAHAIVRKTLEATPTGMCVFHGGKARMWNSAFLVLLDLDPEPSWSDCATRLDVEALRAAEVGEVVKFWTPDQRYLAVRFSALPSGERLVSVDDLTGQERERAIRDRFVAEVVSAQEREARRIAELLHDDAVQQLTALGLRLELSAMQRDEAWLTELARDANAITASLRGLLVELHPAVLESRGLGAALEVIAGNLRTKGLEISVRLSDARIAQELEHLAYRVAQEIMANVVRHAEASQVEVDLTVADGVLRCRIADDGVGFEPKRVETAVGEGHLGLYLARERVEQAGGRLAVESEPGRGTSVEIELPAPAARAEVLEKAAT
jgi:signal transduction histidine kinase